MNYNRISNTDIVIFDSLDDNGIILRQIYAQSNFTRYIENGTIQDVIFIEGNRAIHGIVFQRSRCMRSQINFNNGGIVNRARWVLPPNIQNMPMLSITTRNGPILVSRGRPIGRLTYF